MANAIDQWQSGLTIGHAQLGYARPPIKDHQPAGPRRRHGDYLLLDGNVAVRFLAWTPLRSCTHPATRSSCTCRTADLLYVGDGQVTVWSNQSRQRLRGACHSTPPGTNDLLQLRLADLNGAGIICSCSRRRSRRPRRKRNA